MRGKWLRRRERLAGHAALRHRALLHRIERHAGLAVQQEDVAHLGALSHGRCAATHTRNLEQRGRGRRVVVPDVVMHRLEMPRDLPGLDRQRHGGAAVVVDAMTLAAVEIRPRIAGRHEDQATFVIARDDRPAVRRALLVDALGIIGRAGFPVGGHRVPGPGECAGAGVESAHHTRGGVDLQVVGHEAVDHHAVAHDHGWGCGVVAPAADLAHVRAEIDAAGTAKALAGLAGVGVYGDQLSVRGAVEDPLGAGLPGHGRTVFPVTHAAAVERVWPLAFLFLQFWIEMPDLGAGLGVERENTLERRAVVDVPVHGERRDLEGGSPRPAAGVSKIPAAMRPRDLQRGDVLRRDVGEPGEMRGTGIAPPDGPLLAGPGGGVGAENTGARDQQCCEQRQGGLGEHRLSVLI